MRVQLPQVVIFSLSLSICVLAFSDDMLYSPSMPATLSIPTGGICGDDLKMLIVGSVPKDGEDYPEIIVSGPNGTEALHVKIGVVEDVVWRWAVVTDVAVDNVGTEGDGTTIDFDEPFMIK